MNKRAFLISFILLLIFSQFRSPTAYAANRVIGVSLLTLTNPFFKDMGNSISDEAKKNGYEAIITSCDLDPAKQRTQVKDFIARKVSAIILTPCDSRAVGSPIREANDAGIPVFTADIASMDKNAKVVSHVATDNYDGGRKAAQAMIIALKGRSSPKIAIIGHPEVESVIARERGFRSEISKNGPEIKIVGMWPGGGDKATSFTVAQEILQSHPDLSGFFCINDPTALGAYAAVEIAKKKGSIIIIGFDGQPEGKTAIKDGKIFADAIQFPSEIGRTAVKNIVKYFNGEKVNERTLIPTQLYFKSDADKDPTLK